MYIDAEQADIGHLAALSAQISCQPLPTERLAGRPSQKQPDLLVLLDEELQAGQGLFVGRALMASSADSDRC